MTVQEERQYRINEMKDIVNYFAVSYSPLRKELYVYSVLSDRQIFSIQLEEIMDDAAISEFENNVIDDVETDNPILEAYIVDNYHEMLLDLLDEEGLQETVNIKDAHYYNNLYKIQLGQMFTNTFFVFANHEQQALEILVAFLIETNTEQALMTKREAFDEVEYLEEDIDEMYIYIDASEYMSTNNDHIRYIQPQDVYLEKL
ncbi:MAG: hypothetical protein ACOCQR_02910 [bacterium]